MRPAQRRRNVAAPPMCFNELLEKKHHRRLLASTKAPACSRTRRGLGTPRRLNVRARPPPQTECNINHIARDIELIEPSPPLAPCRSVPYSIVPYHTAPCRTPRQLPTTRSTNTPTNGNVCNGASTRGASAVCCGSHRRRSDRVWLRAPGKSSGGLHVALLPSTDGL